MVVSSPRRVRVRRSCATALLRLTGRIGSFHGNLLFFLFAVWTRLWVFNFNVSLHEHFAHRTQVTWLGFLEGEGLCCVLVKQTRLYGWRAGRLELSGVVVHRGPFRLFTVVVSTHACTSTLVSSFGRGAWLFCINFILLGSPLSSAFFCAIAVYA